MGFGGAVLGALVGAGAGGVLDAFVDPSFMVDDDKLKGLHDLVKGNSSAFGSDVTVTDTAPANGFDSFEIGEKSFLNFKDGFDVTKLSDAAKAALRNAPDKLGEYFMPSVSGITEVTTEKAKELTDFLTSKGYTADQIPGIIDAAKDGAADLAGKLGNSEFIRDWTMSHIIPVVAGGVGGATLGAFTGNQPKAVVGKYTGAEAARMAARSGGQGMPSDLAAAQAPVAGGAHTAQFLQKMQEEAARGGTQGHGAA